MVNMRMEVRPVVARAGVLLGIALALTALTFVLGCPKTSPSSGNGYVVINPRPSELEAGWVLYRGWGDTAYVDITGSGDDSIECVAGDYSLEWQPVGGYTEPSPNPAEGTLRSGETLRFDGTYEPLPGQVFVYIEPDHIEPTWVLSGPGGFEQAGFGAMNFSGMEHGEYTVDWGDIAGYVTPSPDPASGTLLPGGQLQLLGIYTEE